MPDPSCTHYDVDVVSVRKQLDTFLKDSATAMNFRLTQYTLHDEVEEVAVVMLSDYKPERSE